MERTVLLFQYDSLADDMRNRFESTM